MHVSFIHILLPQFLMDILVNIVIFEVAHFTVCLGTLGAGVRDDCWHLWVEEGFRCLGHYVWFTAITIGLTNIPLHLLHFPGKLVQVSQTKVEDITY